MNARARSLFAVAVAATLLAGGGTVQAQGGGGRRNDSARIAGGRGRAAGGRAGRGAPDPQQALRRQIRDRFAEVVRRQLALTDDQAKQLKQVDDKYQQQRQSMQRDEREARQGLRALLEDTTATPDAGKVDQYLNRLVQGERKRADILEGEQKDLSAFLNPVQRAKYMALREQLQHRIADLTAQGRRGGPPPGPPPAQ
ncbi:MAG TPA: Spy/CpxP family protein refolding chaperone [Gemmatimonadaceae bacterium]|nr:Spy/CpxP family protein refolding chaperone [Gemmatimonadaceae bacterium]